MSQKRKINHIKHDYNKVLKQKIVNHKRHYLTPTGSIFPSVTTVTGILSMDGIAKWRKDVGDDVADFIMREASSAGTEFHNICEDYLNNEKLTKYKKLIPLAHFSNAKSALDKIDNVYAQECPLFSTELELAGKVDCIAEYDGVPSIIDFKTSRKEKRSEWITGYFQQATAYSQMWLEQTGKDFKQIVIIVTALDGTLEVYKRDRDDYIDDLKKTIILYHSLNV